MGFFVPVAQLIKHDIGIVYKDKERREPDGGALFCLTSRNTGNIPVNIKDFRNAQLLGIQSVILKIVPMNWAKKITMARANTLMEQARQFEDADYKLISIHAVEGQVEIPDEDLFTFQDVP